MDKLGLDHVDQNILLTMIDKFGGGPVGLDTLAAATGEDAGTIEDVYEPYLILNGLLNRTPRGACGNGCGICTFSQGNTLTGQGEVMNDIILGSHVGMSGKMFLGSVKEAESYGANALMVYTGAPQNTRRKDVSELRLSEGLAYAKECGVKEIIIHAPYIINLANTVKPDTYTFGVSFLAQELKRVAAFQSKILVLHPGSHLGAGAEAGIAQLVEGLNTVLAEDDSDVLIALETMAGKGGEIGRTFEELRMIYDGVQKKDRLRVCFDTCHVHDAGYDLVHDYEGVFQKFDEVIGLSQIAVFISTIV